MSEVKIFFEEGQEVRYLTGTILEETNEAIKLKRKDGIFKIFKTHIIKIEYEKNNL